MPFEVRIGKRDYYDELKYIRHNKRGACSSKHYLLGQICEEVGLKVLYLTYPFRWIDLNVDFPDYIRNLANKMPICYHLAIKVTIEGKRIFLDATWDPPLKRADFKINQIDSKMTDMNIKNAVNPCGECIIHQSGLERSKYIKSLRTGGPTDLEIKFYNNLNSWLNNVRAV